MPVSNVYVSFRPLIVRWTEIGRKAIVRHIICCNGAYLHAVFCALAAEFEAGGGETKSNHRLVKRI